MVHLRLSDEDYAHLLVALRLVRTAGVEAAAALRIIEEASIEAEPESEAPKTSVRRLTASGRPQSVRAAPPEPGSQELGAGRRPR